MEGKKKNNKECEEELNEIMKYLVDSGGVAEEKLIRLVTINKNWNRLTLAIYFFHKNNQELTSSSLNKFFNDKGQNQLTDLLNKFVSYGILNKLIPLHGGGRIGGRYNIYSIKDNNLLNRLVHHAKKNKDKFLNQNE